MCVNAAMNLFGLLFELQNQTTQQLDWTAFIYGSLAGAAPWFCIFAYLIAASASNNSIPGFVWGILVSYIIMFITFPANMILQYLRRGWWGDEYWGYSHGGYYFGEKVYQILSLVAKTLLLWLVVGGANQPNSYSK